MGGTRGQQATVSIEDFCRGPLRAQLVRSFRNFPEDEVEDALSFALEQGVRGLCRGTTEGEVFSWLRTVMLRRLGRERQRRGKVVAATSEGVELELVPSLAPGPEEVLIAKDRCEAVADLVDALPEHTRAVLRARYFENLSRAEIAETTGLTERQVKRHIERAMDAVEGFVLQRLGGPSPCADGRPAVLAYAKGHASRALADAARRHLAACERCRSFHGELRAVRWGAAAAAPMPAVAGDAAPGLASVVEKLHAASVWTKHQLYALGGRADPAAFGGVRGPGTAATVLTCAAIGTAGGATYCVTQGVPDPVRRFVTADHNDAQPDKRPPAIADAAEPAVAVPEPGPTAPSPEPPPPPRASPAPEEPPSPPPPPPEQEFMFERSAAPSSGSTPPPSPAQTASASSVGGGEFAP